MSPAALASRSSGSLEVRSELLGTLEVPAHRVFDFPEGLVGFPECRRFALMDARPGVYWLQSLDHPALTFVVADPFAWVEGFEFDLDIPPGLSTDELAVLAIVTLPREDGAPATLNLQGPLLLSFVAGTGRQLVLQRSPWGIRHPIDLV